MFWLSYRHQDGSFAGAVVIESNALINARMRVALSGAEWGEMPIELLGRLLDPSDLRKLERMLRKSGLQRDP